MVINFPNDPSLNQVYQVGSVFYKWTGVKWKRTNVFESFLVSEYSDIAEIPAGNILIEPEKYNYYKINFDADCDITLPNASLYTSIVLELNREYSIEDVISPTITWSNNIQWQNNTAPTLTEYSTNLLINFITYNGVNWVANQLSLDLRSS